jgi:hypothetical protein
LTILPNCANQSPYLSIVLWDSVASLFADNTGFSPILTEYESKKLRDVRMKADHVENRTTTEDVPSHPGEKGHESKNGVKTPTAPEKAECELEK